jgi:hypothetical protein
MRRPLVLLLALVAAAVATPAAFGGAPTGVTTLEDRSLEARVPERRFTLVGLHWRGPGRVLFRTRSVDGQWSGWRAAAPEDEDGPDPGSRETRTRAGWRIGNPWWVGESDRIETRAIGRVSRVRAYLVLSPELLVPFRVPAAAETPPIVSRLSWGADESIRRGPPTYAPEARFAVVHHTAGRNDYTRAEAAAIVRAIQLYHVQGNGWNDIGYNFLVDRYGTVYEGRFGGVDRNVVGAHAQGFNTGSVGVALLGTYGSTAPSRAAQDAIARLLAWRLDLAHVDPTALLTVVSGGSERYAAGIPVLLRAVSGHRDTGFTECPGDALYTRLDSLSRAAGALGLPKIYEPRVDAAGSVFRFRARVSSSLPWIVTVTDGAGLEVARGTGTGTAVDWTWDSTAAAPGTYAWSIGAQAARPATGSLRAGSGAVPLAIEEASADPEAISPNADGQADTAIVTYSLATAANVTVEVVDSIGGVVATVVDRVWTGAGRHSVVVDGASFPDGSYSVLLTARNASGAEVQQVIPLIVSRTLGLVSAAPEVFSPNGDGRRDRLVITFSLAAPADVRVRILRDSRWVASPLFGSLVPGVQRLVWSGVRASGPIRDGAYSVVVEASDAVGTISFGVPFASDTVSPRVRILSVRPLRVEVSEPAVLTLLVDGVPVRREVKRAGIVRIPSASPVARVRVVAWDAAGNSSGPVVRVTRADSR